MRAAASGRGGWRRSFSLKRLWPYCAAFGALVLLAILIAAVVWLSLPSYDGAEEVPGLDAPVEIVRDANAVPHIYAQSPRDGAFAMGYVHAQDRLWQLEMQRRIGQARLAEVVGEPAVEPDKFLRTLGIYRVAERNFEMLEPEAQAIYEAYAKGVNAYLETHSELLPLEFQLLGHEPEPWRPADSLVWLKIMAWDLGDNFADELLRARLAGTLDRAQLQDLWAQHPDDPAPGPHAALPALEDTGIDFAALAAALPVPRASGLGSNAWVLSGAHTESGMPLLANDPHLRLEVPSVWYLAHVSTPEFDVVGATLPGLPFPLLGQSRTLAWGFTNTGPDVQDLFIERIDPDDPARYLAPEGSLPFEVRTETIGVSGEDPIQLEVRVTRHGPVVSDLLEESGEFLEKGHVLAFSWTALAEDDRSGQALVNATKARNWREFVGALGDLAVPQQTIVFADTEGNIGYVAPGHVPIRATGQGHMPAPGWTGAHDWVDRVPSDALPGGSNPASGRIVTANNRMVGHGYPYYLTDDWTAPYRARRIETLLDARPKHDVASFAAIQQDLVSLAAARLTPVLLELAEPANETMRTALAMLAAWDHGMGRESTEALIYMAWVRELMHVLFADELGDAFEDYWKIRTEPIHRALGERTQWCDDVTTAAEETCSQAVSRALKISLEYLAVTHGHDFDDWRWGEAHAVRMKSRILGEVPAIGSWFEIEMPSGGEKETVKAGGFDVADAERPFAQNHGAGYRAVYDLGDPANSVFVISTGQSGNPLSSHYEDYAEPWRDGEYLPMLRDRAAAEEDALGTLVLRPE
ncbi:MAG: penicillin acylase family protein [Rhodospirillales bacterium]|nr:penicillin acylase family protein [Rhodospirillales bacterium]MDE0378462.1 penicillin acylase family protein [Rhodospirillales bacterium]